MCIPLLKLLSLILYLPLWRIICSMLPYMTLLQILLVESSMLNLIRIPISGLDFMRLTRRMSLKEILNKLWEYIDLLNIINIFVT